MSDQSEPKTLLGALKEATKHGVLYSQYNWVKEDIERMEGKQKEKEKKEEPPKEKRKRGERKVSRVVKVLTGVLEQDEIVLKANGHFLKSLTEWNLDHNGVSFSAAVTRNICTPGNRTLEVHFFSNSRTTIFKKEPLNMEDKIWTLLKEGKTKEDAKNEIIEKTKMRNTKKEGVEKEEKSEEFYMSADNATPVVKIQHLEPEDKREKKHRARNTGEKFKCEHCDSLATWDASLKKHSGEKYICKDVVL